MKTTEQAQKDAAAKFLADMLAVIRARLFKDVPEKLWFQHEAPVVRKAIMEPARYMQERGAALPGTRYRQILLTVVAGIEEHATRDQVRRMSHYLWTSVQKHMLFQGANYYEEGKTPRGITLVIDPALKSMRPKAEARALTETLAATAAALSSRAGRRKKQDQARGIQKDLFA